MSLITDIGIENLLSLILVKENVRPAFLLQPANYNEFSGNDKITRSILISIKNEFPELLYSEDYTNYQGIIISNNKKYNGCKDITNEEMGNILGYPCYKGFDSIDKTLLIYFIDIVVHLNNGEQYIILTNSCIDTLKLNAFNTIAENAKIAFNNVKYQYLLGQ